jgi:ABC-type polysaccharide/polyol phosphate export permease
MSTSQHLLRTGRRGLKFEVGMAFADFRNALGRLNLAGSLAWHDVLARYRGSVLGPFWITLSMAAMVLGIGVLYARLFKMDLGDFLPFVAVSIVLWGTITSIIVEGCDTFVAAGGMLRQTALPMFVFVWRALFRSLINLAHHMVIIVVVLVWYQKTSLIGALLSLCGLMVVLLNVTWVATLAAITSARFRDVPQIVGAVMQFAMFMTPVFWKPDQLNRSHVLLEANPFYYMFDVVRRPLLGEAMMPRSWPLLATMAVLGWIAAFAVFTATRRRIVHYL